MPEMRDMFNIQEYENSFSEVRDPTATVGHEKLNAEVVRCGMLSNIRRQTGHCSRTELI